MTPIDQPPAKSGDVAPVGSWSLDPGATFLNHGSFGALPVAVKEHQEALRDRFSAQPAAFFASVLDGELDEARSVLAAFVGADPSDLVFVPNATTGVNAVLRSLTFDPGDELVVTNHGYAACENALQFVAKRWQAKVVVANVPFPIQSSDQVVASVMCVVSDKTRLVLLDHITSPTGLIFPIAGLIATLNERGIEILIDGAHAPGQLDLNIRSLGATYYTGNCHKWLCAPSGAAFLVVQKDRQDVIHPVSIGHGYGKVRSGRSRFHESFDWPGTDDLTAYLCVPKAIETVGAMLPGGWPAVRERNQALLLAAREMVSIAFGAGPTAPDDMIAQMACVPLAMDEGRNRTWHGDTGPVHEWLWNTRRIDAVTVPWSGPDEVYLRLSAHLYNSPPQYARLVEALREFGHIR